MNREGTLLLSGNFGTQSQTSISVMRIASDGALTGVPGSPFKMGAQSFNNRSVSIATYPTKNCSLLVTSLRIEKKKLLVFGSNFDSGSVILLNGEKQKSKNDKLFWTTVVIGKKAGKKVRAGDRIQIRTSSGRLSNEFIVTVAHFD